VCRVAGLLACLVLGRAPAHADDGRFADLSGYLVPISSFDTDDGLGGGLRLELAHRPEGSEPFQSLLVFQSFVSLRGYQQHKLRWDRRGLGRNGDSRLFVHLEWRQWLNDGYWGIGNGTTRELNSTELSALDAEDPDRKRYRYTLFQPFAHVGWSSGLGHSPWSVYGAVQPRYSRVETYAGSLLAEEQPFGMAGGFALQLMGGVIFDQREPEIAPRRGWMLEMGGRMVPDLDGEAGGFGGPIGVLRHFQPVGDRMVWAHRWMGEYLLGSVPFYEMVHWGGFMPVPGFGGAMTLRGLSLGRWRAPGKAILNSELRVDLVQYPVGSKHHLRLELAPFVDLGTVFGAGEQAPSNPIHPAAGVGFRVIMDETFVGRLDLGLGYDPVEGLSSVREQLSPGMYIFFDHPY
jgi:hypothetical protein